MTMSKLSALIFISIFLTAANWSGGGKASSPVTLRSTAATQVPLTITLHASQSVEGLIVEQSDGTDLFEITAGGRVNANLGCFSIAGTGFDNDAFATTKGSQWNLASGASNPGWELVGYNGSTDFLSMVRLVVNKASNRGMIITAAASQTANLLEFRSSADAVTGFIDDDMAMSGFQQNQVAATATTITAAQCGSSFINGGAVEIELPEASTVIGCRLTFITGNASNFHIDPDAGDQILVQTNAAGDRALNATLGNSITIEAISTSEWVPISVVGTWSDAD